MTEAVGGTAPTPQFESDFSFRKMKLATIILLAQMFATNIIAFLALTLVNVPMTKEFGWTQTEFSLAQTAMMWAGAASLPLFGRIMDRVGVRLPIMLGTVGVGFTIFALSRIDGALWQFYLCFAFIGMFGCTAMGYTKVVGALFTQHRGKAMAIIGVESTLAGAFIPPILHWLIADFGWRGMYQVNAIIILLLVPMIYFNLDEPGEIDSDRRLFKKREQVEKPAAPPLPGMDGKAVLMDRVFWFILIATIIGTAPRSGMMPFLVPMLQEKGFTSADAAWFMSAMTLLAPLGSLVAGFALDKIHDAKVAIPFKLVSFLGLLCFLFVTAQFGGWYLLLLSVAFTGFAFGTANPIGTYLHIRFFGLKAFGFYYGFESAFLAFAMGGAAPLVGMLREESGSYTSAYLVMLVCLGFGTILYAVLGRYRYAADIGAVPLQPVSPAAELEVEEEAALQGPASFAAR